MGQYLKSRWKKLKMKAWVERVSLEKKEPSIRLRRGKNKSEISRIEERELREFLFVSLAKY